MTRSLVLSALFGATAWLLASIGPVAEAAPRWPSADDVYAVEGWTVSSPQVDTSRSGFAMVTRTYAAPDGTSATFVISSSPIAKAVYRAGAAVPFLGNGYTVEAMPATSNREAIVARRGDEAWLQISAYGERRGQLGSGALAWGLSVFDAVLGRSNDYYLARVIAPAGGDTEQVRALSDVLFARVAAYYGS